MVVDRRCFIDLCIGISVLLLQGSRFDRISQYYLVPIRVV